MKSMEEDIPAKIFVADQGKTLSLRQALSQMPKFDIVIDDGSHRPKDQKITFRETFKQVNEGGIYAIEDLHTSYRENYGGGYLNKDSFVEYLKSMIDSLHREEYGVESCEEFNGIFSLNFYPGLAIIEKRARSTYGGSTVRPEHP